MAVQLGGSDPAELARAARICADCGYAAVNLNVGCPSDRVQDGRFGACLMREPALVGDCVAAMKAAVSLPVTVKCRIGVDDQDPGEALDRAHPLACRQAGVDEIVVHARKAWLQGLSPKEKSRRPRRSITSASSRLKAANPDLPVSINGGIRAIETARALLVPRDGVTLDGVMLGRAAYQDPELLLRVDTEISGEAAPPVADAFAAIEAFAPYIAHQLEEGVRLASITRHMLGLFAGKPGARLYRRHLSTHAIAPDAGLDTLRAAVAHVREAIGAARAGGCGVSFTPGDPGFEARVRASFSRQSIMTTLGATLTRIEPGMIEIALPFAEHILQQHGFVHAGVVATIADSAAGYAGLTLMPPGAGVLTAEFKINLLAPAQGDRLVAQGRVIKIRSQPHHRRGGCVCRDGWLDRERPHPQTRRPPHGDADEYARQAGRGGLRPAPPDIPHLRDRQALAKPPSRSGGSRACLVA